MADQTKGTSRSIYMDATAALTSMQKLVAEGDKLKLKINEGEAAGKTMNKELAKFDQVNAKIKNVQQQLDAGLKPTLVQQQNLVRQLNNELARMSENDPAFKAKLETYRKQNAELSLMRERMSSVNKAQQEMGTTFGKFGQIFTHVFEAFTSYAIISKATELIKDFFTGTIEEALQAEKSTSRLKNTLENISRTDAFDRLSKKADEIAKQFKYLDNDDVVEVFNKLITYGKLTERQISQLTPVIADFAAKQGISIEESSSVIIKALEGNSKALKEYGINIKDGGNVTERFGILMTDLKGRVDGAGDAFGKTFKGQLAIAKQEMKDAQEEIGNNLIPVLSQLTIFASNALKGLIDMGSFLKSAFSSGSFVAAIGANYAKNISEGQKKADDQNTKSLIDAFKTNAEGKLRSNKEILDIIQKQNDSDEGKLAMARVNGDLKSQRIYDVLVANNNRAIDELKSRMDPKQDQVLGIDSKKDPAVDEEKIKKLKELHDQYVEFMAELNTAAAVALPKLDAAYIKIQSELEKDLRKIDKLSEGLTKDEISAGIKAAQDKAVASINAEYDKLHKKFSASPIPIKTDFDQKKLEDDIDKGLTKTAESLSKKPGVFDRLMGIFNRDKKAKSELAVITSAPNSKERLDAQLQQLREEEAQAIAMSDQTDAQISLIHEQYAQKSNELIKNHQIAQIDEIIGYAQQATNILKEIDQAQTNKENAELQRQVKANDKKRKDIQSLAKSKVISEVEAQKQLADLDAEDAKKKEELQKKQFERGKKLSIAQALINGAMAVTATLAAIPGPLDLLSLSTGRYIAIAAALATTAAQVAVIGSQKFEKGGIAKGASHGEGGIKLFDSKSKRIVGEMEGDEPYMILSKNFRRNNPEFIAAALDSSMNRNGARIRPFWENRPYSRLDYGGVIKSQAIVRKFETGGIFNGQSGNINNGGDDTVIRNMMSLLADNHDSLEKLRHSTDYLNNHLDRGIKSVISLNQLDTAYDQRARIIADAAP